MTASVDPLNCRSAFRNSPQWPAFSLEVSSLEEERHEVFDSVLQSISATEADPDRLAACAYLLRHLARTGSRS